MFCNKKEHWASFVLLIKKWISSIKVANSKYKYYFKNLKKKKKKGRRFRFVNKKLRKKSDFLPKNGKFKIQALPFLLWKAIPKYIH